MMIKPDEFRTLIDYYKGKISESTLLDKAERVAAKAQILIDDPNTPAALKELVLKEMLKEKNKLNDKLRQGPSVAMTAPGVPQPPHQRQQDGWVTRKTVERIGKIHKCQHTIHCPPNHRNTFDGKKGVPYQLLLTGMYSYDAPIIQYVKLRNPHIEEIETEISETDTNQLVQFSQGATILTVHFRKAERHVQ